MTISSCACVIVTCSRCGDHQNSDECAPAHYATVEAARVDHVGSAWLWGTAGPECPGCLQRDREMACPGHVWRVDPPTNTSWGPRQRRECALCSAVDVSRDQGRSWIFETNAVIADLELQFVPGSDPLLPAPAPPGPKGIQDVRCAIARCDTCGADYEEDAIAVHFASEADLVDECAAAGWSATSKTGVVTCEACGQDPASCPPSNAPTPTEGSPSPPSWTDSSGPSPRGGAS